MVFKGIKNLFGKGESAEEKAFRERSQRVRILDGQRIVFQWQGHDFQVQNISETGLGLFLMQDFAQLPVKMSGHLKMQEISIPMDIEVRRKTDVILGCQIVSDRSELRKLIRRHFQTELQAGKMSEVAQEHLQAQGRKPRWFFAPGAYELYVQEEGENIYSLQLSFQGHFIEAELGKALKYGSTRRRDEEENTSISQINRSALVQWQKEPIPAEVLQEALRVVGNVEALKPREREQLTMLLKSKV